MDHQVSDTMDSTFELQIQDCDELKVAILTQNLKLGHEISKGLRNNGVFAYYYRELDEIWEYLNEETPDLLICDVLSLHQNERSLAEHPKVLTGKVSIGFYLNRRTQSFVTTAYRVANIGFIHHDISLTHQISNMVNTARMIQKNKLKAQQFELQTQRYQKNYSQQEERISHAQEAIDRMKKTAEIVKKFQVGSYLDQDDFIQSFAHFLDEWKLIENYSFYCLNSSAQKLISPRLSSLKFVKTPPLWLGKNCEDGIEMFAQEMAMQVIFETMGVHSLLLRIEGSHHQPDFLVFLKLRNSEHNHYQWGLMETLLSNLYRKTLLQKQKHESVEQFIGIWDVFHLLDEASHAEKDAGYRFVNINLSTLNQAIALRERDFKWKSFFSDFLLELSQKMQGDVKISTFGTLHILCLLPEGAFTANYERIKKFIHQFEYWNYFAKTPVLSTLDYPSLGLIQPSSANFLKKWFFTGADSLRKKSQLISHENTL